MKSAKHTEGMVKAKAGPLPNCWVCLYNHWLAMIDVAIHITYQPISTSNNECYCRMHNYKLLFLLDVPTYAFLVYTGICKGLVTGLANSHATFHIVFYIQLHHLYAISKISPSVGWGDWQALKPQLQYLRTSRY